MTSIVDIQNNCVLHDKVCSGRANTRQKQQRKNKEKKTILLINLRWCGCHCR